MQVKLRTSNYNDFEAGSHVMEYGSRDIKPEKVYLYQGFDPDTINLPGNQIGFTQKGVVNQRDADLLFMWERVIELQTINIYLSVCYSSPWHFQELMNHMMFLRLFWQMYCWNNYNI